MSTRDSLSPAAGPSLSPSRPSLSRALAGRFRDLALLPALVVLIVVGALVSPAFLTQANITTILTSSAALALVVLAESLIIITGKFDLSLESTAGFAPAIGALVVLPIANNGFGLELPTIVGMLLVLSIGAIVGFINGFLIVRLQLNAFIVTLAMLIILRGMLVGASKGRTLFDLPDAFYALMIVTFLGIPLAVWLAALALPDRRARAQISPARARALCDRRQSRGRRAPPASASSGLPGASTCSRASWHRSVGWSSPAMSARSAPTRATA